MESLTIEYLSNSVELAKELDYLFVGVLIEMDGVNKPQLVVNQVEDFDSILAYFARIYKENLNQKFTTGKRISAFTFGNSLSEVEKYLLAHL